MSYAKVHPNNNHKREYIDMHSSGDHQLLEDNFNKKLKIDNDEKYKQNLAKFQRLEALLENNYTNVFDVTSKLFNQNGLNEFENVKFYNNIMKNENSLTNGVRLSNISRRIVNKNVHKKSVVMKKDGIRSFYDLAYKKKLEQANKLINNDVVAVNKPKAEVPTQQKKSLFSNVATVKTSSKDLKNSGTFKGSSTSLFSSKNKTPQEQQTKTSLPHKAYHDDEYSAEDYYDDEENNSSSFSSDDSSSEISLTSDSEVHGYNEDYWKEHNKERINNTKLSKFKQDDRLFNDYKFLETMTEDENNEDYEEYCHKKWDTLLEKKGDLMKNSMFGAKQRIDTFDDDKDSVFDAKQEPRNSISNAPKTAHTLLPIAFHTHMFLGNNRIEKEKNDLSIVEEDLNFYSEKGIKR